MTFHPHTADYATIFLVNKIIKFPPLPYCGLGLPSLLIRPMLTRLPDPALLFGLVVCSPHSYSSSSCGNTWSARSRITAVHIWCPSPDHPNPAERSFAFLFELPSSRASLSMLRSFFEIPCSLLYVMQGRG